MALPPDQSDHDCLRLLLHRRGEMEDGLADDLGPRRNDHLADVVLDLEQFLRRALPLPLGGQPPAQQRDENESRHGHSCAHGREVEHAEGGCARLGPIDGDDDVGRRADQSDQPAHQRAERQRHEQQRRRPAALAGHPDRHRHHQRQGPHIVHESRAQHHDAGQRCHLHHRPGAYLRQTAREAVHDTGIEQAAAEHQYGGHGDHRRMPEPQENLLGRHQTGDENQQEGGDRDQIVAPAAPDEQHQGGRQDGENNRLIKGEVHLRKP